MNDEIREILRILKSKSKRYEYCLNANISFSDESYEAHLLLDYITNLQQDLEKANDIIVKDREFYKNRMDEYAELKKENEILKEKVNILTGKAIIEKDKKAKEIKIKALKQEDYKFRCEKAVEYIQLYASYDNNFCLDYHDLNPLLNILQNGSESE